MELRVNRAYILIKTQYTKKNERKYFSDLRANLVATLASLHVNDFSHVEDVLSWPVWCDKEWSGGAWWFLMASMADMSHGTRTYTNPSTTLSRLVRHLVNATRWFNVDLMLGQRLRRWPNFKSILGQRLVLAEQKKSLLIDTEAWFLGRHFYRDTIL